MNRLFYPSSRGTQANGFAPEGYLVSGTGRRVSAFCLPFRSMFQREFRRKKICALYFKICLTYFKICQTYFFFAQMWDKRPENQFPFFRPENARFPARFFHPWRRDEPVGKGNPSRPGIVTAIPPPGKENVKRSMKKQRLLNLILTIYFIRSTCKIKHIC